MTAKIDYSDIDAVVTKLAQGPGLNKALNLSDGINIVRRYADVSIDSADNSAGESSLHSVREEWEKLADLASKAEVALRDMLKFMADKDSQRLPREVWQISQGLLMLAPQDLRIPERSRHARRLARTLLDGHRGLVDFIASSTTALSPAAEITAVIHQVVAVKASTVGSPRRPGDRDQEGWRREFTRVLYEGWVRLAGKRPGSTTEAENPFMVLLNKVCVAYGRPEMEAKQSGWKRHVLTAKDAVPDEMIDEWTKSPQIYF